MDTARISELLRPFLAKTPNETDPVDGKSAGLSPAQLNSISTYIDLLLRWNARINLTAIRHPEEIVTRHFGESLFAARHLFPRQTYVGADVPVRPVEQSSVPPRVIDVGSGAGFPGLPIKIWEPQIHLTLIESNQKKSTFLREVARTLTLTDIDVFQGRAEANPAHQANIVTLRAVENFQTALPAATRLLSTAGRMALLVGESQLTSTYALTPGFSWQLPIPIPLSTNRILLIGTRNQK